LSHCHQPPPLHLVLIQNGVQRIVAFGEIYIYI
jgi:hypothetical protein